MKKFIVIGAVAVSLLGLLGVTASPHLILAQTTPPQTTKTPKSTNLSRSGIVPCGNEKTNPCTLEDIFNVIVNVTNYAIGLAGLITIASIIWAGFSIVLGSTTNAIADGKKRLTNSILGLILVTLAFLIVNGVLSFVGKGAFTGDTLLNQPQGYICNGNCPAK